MTKPYGVRIQKFGRDGRLTSTEKFFATDAQREKYIEQEESKPNFHQVLAYCDEPRAASPHVHKPQEGACAACDDLYKERD